MSKLPYSRTVNVSLTRNDAFPSRRGFGTAILLTSLAVAGVLDATHRTKAYGSIDEVAVDFNANQEFYRAATFAFSQNPRPTRIKAGFLTVPAVTADIDESDISDELDALFNADQDFYFVGIERRLRDTPAADAVTVWTEAHNKLAIIGTNDVLHEDPTDDTTISARFKGVVERTATFYDTDPTQYADFALAALLSTFNFDEADSAYTAKYKRLRGVVPINVGVAAITAISGFVEEVGQSDAIGHLSNAYIDIGGRDFVVEGSTLTANVFIDEIHATDWIIARTEEEALGILLNNARIPFTDAGMQTLASAARVVMRQATRAGLIAEDRDPETGEYAPALTITVPSVFDVPASQRKARIAPEIAVTFRYAGAVHYTTIRYQMTF